MPSAPSRSQTTPVNEPRYIGLLRLALWLVVIVGLTTGGIWGYLWWDEGPLREANAALNRGDTALASKLVQTFLKTHSPHDGALAMKARILVATGRYDDALDLFSKVGPASLADLKACAQACLHLKQWAQAVGLLDRALQLSPRDPDVLHEITAARAFLGNAKEALATAEQLSQIPGYEARGYIQIGTIERDCQNRKKAIAAWTEVLKFDPEAKQIQLPGEVFFHDLGVLYLDDGDAKTALQMLERSVQIKSHTLGLVHRGQAKLQLGRRDEAIQDWKKALELEPAHREAREDLASVALERRQADEAVEWLEPLVAAGELTSSTSYLMQRSAALQGNQAEVERWRKKTEELRKLERIKSTVDHLLIESPQSFWAQVMRAYRFAEEGNWQQAEIQIEPVMKDAPKEAFLRDLVVAIQSRGPLPSLEKLPIK